MHVSCSMRGWCCLSCDLCPDCSQPIATEDSKTLRKANISVQGGEAHVDVAVRKLSIVALGRALRQCAARPSFASFAVRSVGARCCLAGLTNGSVDVRDGAALGLMLEASNVLVALDASYGADFRGAAAQYVQVRPSILFLWSE